MYTAAGNFYIAIARLLRIVTFPVLIKLMCLVEANLVTRLPVTLKSNYQSVSNNNDNNNNNNNNSNYPNRYTFVGLVTCSPLIRRVKFGLISSQIPAKTPEYNCSCFCIVSNIGLFWCFYCWVCTITCQQGKWSRANMHLESSRTSTMELFFAKIANIF